MQAAMSGSTKDADDLLQELGVVARNADQVEKHVIEEALANLQPAAVPINLAAGSSADVLPPPVQQSAQGKAVAKARAKLRAINNEIKALQANQLPAAEAVEAADAALLAANPQANAEHKGKRRKAPQGPAPTVPRSREEDGAIVISSSSDEERTGQPGSSTANASSLAVGAASTLQEAVARQRLADLRQERQRLTEQLARLLDAPAATASTSASTHRAASKVLPGGAAGSSQAAGGSKSKPGSAAAAAAGGSGVSPASKTKPGGKPAAKAQIIVPVSDDDLFGSSSSDEMLAGPSGGKAKGMVESQRDRAVRLGLITPFGALQGFERRAKGAAAASTIPNPFDRRPLERSTLNSVGRAGKPLGELMHQMGSKVKASVAARPAAKLMDASELPSQERAVRHIPAHFWQNASSGKRLPPSLEGVAAGGVIPNLAATRAPLPPLKRKKPTRKKSAAQEESEDDEGGQDQEGDESGSDGAGRAQGRRRQRPRRAVGRQATGSGQGGGAGTELQASQDGAGSRLVAAAPRERGAAKRALQRLGQLAEEEGSDQEQESMEVSEGSEYAPSDGEAAKGAKGRGRPAGAGNGSLAELEDDVSSLDGLVSEGDDDLGRKRGRRRPQAKGKRKRLRHANSPPPGSSGGDSSSGDGSSDAKGGDGGGGDVEEDLEGRYDDADQEYYERRLAAAVLRIRDEDETAAAAAVHGVGDADLASPAAPGEGGKKKARIKAAVVDGVKHESKEGLLAKKEEPGEESVQGVGVEGVGGSQSIPGGGGGGGAHGHALSLHAGAGAVVVDPDPHQVDDANAPGSPAGVEAALGAPGGPRGDAGLGGVPDDPAAGRRRAAGAGAGARRAGGLQLSHPAAHHYEQMLRELQQEDGVDAVAAQQAAVDAAIRDEPGLVREEHLDADPAHAGWQFRPGAVIAAERAAAASGDGGQGDDAQGRQRAGGAAAARRSQQGGGTKAGAGRGRQAGRAGEPDEAVDFVEFEGGLKVPLRVWSRLFGYQRTGVQWLWELHCQQTGGILGDEMGLGKTIQIAAYLGALLDSGRWPGAALIVCPATVLRQWLRELRKWAPRLRVVILHESARAPGYGAGGSGEPRPDRKELVQIVMRSGSGVLLTTYEQLRLNRSLLLRARWGVAVLDEGHKIRNPDAEVTLVAKQLPTPHRLVVSGSPIQNRLSELWSLFDFVFPGKLGTLPVFQAQFAIPIQVGGYTNASKLQVNTAYRCALVLRDLVAPHLLRRRKADVAIQLPAKTEQVLFCSMTSEQLELYRAYLASGEVAEILERRRQALAGIDILRKITNHPDLLERLRAASADEYGLPEKSGKLTVAKRLLQHWSQTGHKTLLFCQTQQMLDIIEKMVGRMGLTYYRMDGSTSIAIRARLMDDFNGNPDIAVFLLTTKVGGLGVNLTGADRVLLYDPDWNPATDTQARERAWRIGQERPVTIYRLITSGTIEEKVYHRQVYKSFLTNKVLKDPRQKRFFASKDLHDLFTLGDEYTKRGSNKAAAAAAQAAIAGLHGGVQASAQGPTETARIFGDAGHDIEVQHKQLEPRQAPSSPAGELDDDLQALIDGEMEMDGQQGGGEAGPSRGRSSQGTPGSASRSRGGGVRAGARQVAGGDDDEEGGEGEGGAKDEARILRDLFDGAGVRSLVDHDRVEGANDPEALRAEAEASRVAARAAEALRQSRAQCMRAPVNEPTWTGRAGAAGAPRARPNSTAGNNRPGGSGGRGDGGGGAQKQRFGKVGSGRGVGSGGASGAGPSGATGSAALLQQLRIRQQEAADPGGQQAGAGGEPSSSGAGGDAVAAQLLAAEIVGYLDREGGPNREATGSQLMAVFKSKVQDMSLLRQLLDQVAVQNRNFTGVYWRLKQEFWGTSGGAQARD